MKTLTDLVAELVDQGLSSREIANTLSADFGVVSQLALRIRKRRGFVRVGQDVLKSMEPHARARGIGATELARRLLTVLVNDGLVSSVLDDDVKPEPKPRKTKGKPCPTPKQPSP